jgi:hypothetical protein
VVKKVVRAMSAGKEQSREKLPHRQALLSQLGGEHHAILVVGPSLPVIVATADESRILASPSNYNNRDMAASLAFACQPLPTSPVCLLPCFTSVLCVVLLPAPLFYTPAVQ